MSCQFFSQINCRLSTKLNNNAFWLFKLDYRHNILFCKWLKIKFIRNWKVCWNSFWIVIYDNCLITRLFYCLHSVNCSIVKFNTLPNSNRSWAKYNNFFLIPHNTFIFLLISWVKIRCFWLKFSRTGINHLKHRLNIAFFTKFVNFIFCRIPTVCNNFVWKSISFGKQQCIWIIYIRLQFNFNINNIFHFVKEKHVNLCNIVYFLRSNSSS